MPTESKPYHTLAWYVHDVSYIPDELWSRPVFLAAMREIQPTHTTPSTRPLRSQISVSSARAYKCFVCPASSFILRRDSLDAAALTKRHVASATSTFVRRASARDATGKKKLFARFHSHSTIYLRVRAERSPTCARCTRQYPTENSTLTNSNSAVGCGPACCMCYIPHENRTH